MGAAALLAVVAVGGLLLWSELEEPTVESVETELGAVSNESTTVHSTIVVRNPNDREFSDVAVSYTIRMNDVEMATGRETGVRLGPGRNVIGVSAALDNGRVPDWWVTHVRRAESTNLTTTATVTVGALPFSVGLPPQRRPLDTDLLGALAEENATNVTMGETTLVRVGDRRGRWGNASTARTPVHLRTPLENRHNRTVSVDTLAYTVRMNDVVVGEGTDEGFALQPGERRTVTVDAHIDPARMERWWVTHLRRNQSTRLAVEVAGVVERDGERTEVPLHGMGTRADVETDLFGDGTTTVRRLPAPPGLTYEPPCVRDRASRWGEPTDTFTPIVTTVSGCNPNEGTVADLLYANVSRRTTIGDFEVAANRTLTPLPKGEFAVETRSRMRNDEVPIWWAAHLERGERSRVHTAVDGAADVGVTTFPLGLEDRERTVETDMLAGLNDESPQTVTVEGRPALTVQWTRASWENVTPERAPIRVRMRVRNENPRDAATIRDLNYSVRLGETVLADRESPDEWTIGAGTTRTIETTIVLNNTRMADWWPGHVRRGEESRLVVESYATVESGGETERTRLDFLGSDRVVETALLGQNGTEA